MRGEHHPISLWLNAPSHPSTLVYLDANIWQEFVNWIRPTSATDNGRLQKLRQKDWQVFVFRDQLNRHLNEDRGRDKAFKDLGIEIINATGSNKINRRDELFISELVHVYFGDEDFTLARRQAEFLLLARRYTAGSSITLLTQNRSFRRIPMVNTYYLDGKPLQGKNDLPATFEFLTDFDIHPAIAQAIRRQLANPHCGHVMQDALVGLCDHIRQKSGLTNDGSELMDQAFSGQSPKIKLNPLTDSNKKSSQQNEQRGYHQIFKGVIMALRNTLAHEGAESAFTKSRYPDQKTLLKYLSFLSLLCERADQPLP